MTGISPLKLKGAHGGPPGTSRPTKPRSESISVSWLNGRMDVAFRTADRIQIWTGPDSVASVEALGELLKQGRNELNWGSGEAALILSHAALGSLLVEVPSASPAVLRHLVEREVGRQKTFEGPAVWCETSVILPEQGHARSVHFMPRELADRLSAAFGVVGLRLTRIVPASEFLRTAAGEDALMSESTFLASALIPGGLLFSVSHQGCGVLQRQVPVGPSDSAQWGVELKRTLVYARQHLRVVVEDVRLVGAETDLRAVSGEDLPANIRPTRKALTTADWNRWWLGHGGPVSVNLAGSPGRDRVQRGRLYRLSRTVGWLSVAVALVLGFWLEQGVREEHVEQGRLNSELSRQRDRLQSARRALDRRREQMEILQRWNEHELPPVYLWLPTALQSNLPSTLVLTQVVLRAKAGSWTVTLAGKASPGETVLDSGSVDRFRRTLEQGVIPIRWWGGVAAGTATGAASGDATGHWAQRLMEPPGDPRSRPQRFQWEGQIP